MSRTIAIRVCVVGVLLAIPVAGQPYQAQVTLGQPYFTAVGEADCEENANQGLENCGFETGMFPAWVDSDIASPFFPLQVNTAGVNVGFGFFTSAPTQGTFAALHGWDGDGPGRIRVTQEMSLLNGADTISFSYRAAWDMTFGATQPRAFKVRIEEPLAADQCGPGGGLLASHLILQADPGTTVLDTGDLIGEVDISPFAGMDVCLVFEWVVPESFTGPGFFQLDNVDADNPVPVDLQQFSIE